MDKFNFDKIIKNLERTKKTLPLKLANETKNYFLSAFDKQAWDGQKWKEVNRRISGTKEYKRATQSERTRNILIGKGSGKLRPAVNKSLKEYTFEKIRFVVSGIDYAAIHNYGLPMKNGKLMPKRTYMGDTKELRAKQLDLIKRNIGGIWNG